MISIRLTRIGRRHRPYYRVVVADSRRARDGRFIEVIGHYDPLPKPAVIEIDTEKVDEWVSKGAKVSDTVRALVSKHKERAAGIVKEERPKKKAKGAAAEAAVEKPAEEAKPEEPAAEEAKPEEAAAEAAPEAPAEEETSPEDKATDSEEEAAT